MSLNNNIENKYLKIAYEEAKNSDDPHTAVGCVIVNNNVIISKGYNHFINIDKKLSFPKIGSDSDPVKTKYPYIIHAEMDALLKTKDPSKWNGATAYVTLHPCKECCKHLIQLGIKEIYYHELDDAHKKQEVFSTSIALLKKFSKSIKITKI